MKAKGFTDESQNVSNGMWCFLQHNHLLHKENIPDYFLGELKSQNIQYMNTLIYKGAYGNKGFEKITLLGMSYNLQNFGEKVLTNFWSSSCCK